jgi:hypothetical protein
VREFKAFRPIVSLEFGRESSGRQLGGYQNQKSPSPALEGSLEHWREASVCLSCGVHSESALEPIGLRGRIPDRS